MMAKAIGMRHKTRLSWRFFMLLQHSWIDYNELVNSFANLTLIGRLPPFIETGNEWVEKEETLDFSRTIRALSPPIWSACHFHLYKDVRDSNVALDIPEKKEE